MTAELEELAVISDQKLFSPFIPCKLPRGGGEGSLFERQGMAVQGVLPPGMEQLHMELPRGATDEDRLVALEGELRFPRSSSMTDSLRESTSIPPPPQQAPPPPPSPYHLDTGPPPAFCPPPPPGRGQDQGRSSFRPGSEAKLPPLADGTELLRASAHADRHRKARSMIILQDSAHLPVEPTDIPRLGPTSTPPEKIKRKGRVIDNPYANVGQFSMGLYTPAKPQRKKSPLVKQLQVEDAQERAALASAHARDLSPTGRLGPPLPPERAAKGPFAAAIAGAVKDREKRLQERRKSTVFLSVGAVEEAPPEPPSLSQSRSIDERLLSSELSQLPHPPLLLGPTPSATTFIHPLTGKPLDPSSPLALALAARERALTSQSHSPTGSPELQTKHPAPASLYAEPQTKESKQAEGEGGPASPTHSPAQSQRGTPTSPHAEEEPLEEREGRKGTVLSVLDMAQQKTAGQVLVHATSNGQAEEGPEEERPTSPLEPPSDPPRPPTEHDPAPTPPSPVGEKTLPQGSSEEDAEAYVTLPPALLSSSDEETREELRRIGVVPPPHEFANGLQGQPGGGRETLQQPEPLAVPAAPTPSSGPGPGLAPAGGAASGKSADGLPAPESAADSGVEEVDTRSSSDHHLETTSTVSTVSSMSTLSSESGEPMDTHSSHADGQTFTLDKPPVPPKPRLKRPVTFRDPLLKQSSDSELLPQQHAATPGRPRYLFQRRSKLWGDPAEPRPPPSPEEGVPTVMGELSSRLQQLNKDTHSLGDEPMGTLHPGRKSPVSGARLFSSLGELHTISQRGYGASFTVRPGSHYPLSRRSPSPGKGSPDRTDPLGPIRALGLASSPTPPTILKSSSLSLPLEPKEVRFVMRSASARSRSPSPSPSPALSPLLALRPFHTKPLPLWSKYDVGDWLESLHLGEHRGRFQDHEIEGSHLPALTKDDFAELGVTRVGHRMNIERALKQLLQS
ncbi:hypothetical protein JZ751_016641 [Albula glossodonta]|nr:hypothetical protein JZ751_016641 [Albula glossodonta]